MTIALYLIALALIPLWIYIGSAIERKKNKEHLAGINKQLCLYFLSVGHHGLIISCDPDYYRIVMEAFVNLCSMTGSKLEDLHVLLEKLHKQADKLMNNCSDNEAEEGEENADQQQ